MDNELSSADALSLEPVKSCLHSLQASIEYFWDTGLWSAMLIVGRLLRRTNNTYLEYPVSKKPFELNRELSTDFSVLGGSKEASRYYDANILGRYLAMVDFLWHKDDQRTSRGDDLVSKLLGFYDRNRIVD